MLNVAQLMLNGVQRWITLVNGVAQISAQGRLTGHKPHQYCTFMTQIIVILDTFMTLLSVLDRSGGQESHLCSTLRTGLTEVSSMLSSILSIMTVLCKSGLFTGRNPFYQP